MHILCFPLPESPSKLPKCSRFAKSELQRSTIIKKTWCIIPFLFLCGTWFLLIGVVCGSRAVGTDFAHRNQAADVECLRFTHMHLGALPGLVLHRLLLGLSVCLSPPPALISFFSRPARYDSHWLLWKQRCRAWVELPRRVLGSSENLRCLDRNG